MTEPFCDAGCKECYEEDKRAGLVYPLMLVNRDDVPVNVSCGVRSGNMATIEHHDYCSHWGYCAYCGTDLGSGGGFPGGASCIAIKGGETSDSSILGREAVGDSARPVFVG